MITALDWSDARLLWDYHHLEHRLSRCDVAVGLGCRDLAVAEYAAELYRRGLFPEVVFSGGVARAGDLFPSGEGEAFRGRARACGVPDSAIWVEPRAGNTGENIAFSRRLLEDAGRTVRSVLLVSMPTMERRAFATCRKKWPEVDIVCASEPVGLAEYVTRTGDPVRMINVIVADMQRVLVYPTHGFAIAQPVPDDIHAAYRRLVARGYTWFLV